MGREGLETLSVAFSLSLWVSEAIHHEACYSSEAAVLL